MKPEPVVETPAVAESQERDARPDDQGGGGRREVAQTEDTLNVNVVSQDGAEIYFKIKPTTKLSKLMHAYCEKQGVDPLSYRFLYDGRRIQGADTPGSLEMEDDDVIDVLMTQTGGKWF